MFHRSRPLFCRKEEYEMREAKTITILSNGTKRELNVNTVLYILMKKNYAEIHTFSGKHYKTRITLNELEKDLGDSFLKVSRGCLVSVMAIHDISNVIELTTGESLPYSVRNRNAVVAQLQEKQKLIISRFSEGRIPEEEEAYHAHYRCFDDLPIAFADIEMVFDDERRAVDWIFRYGNQALALLEKIPLEKLIGSTFSNLFPNMNDKWLRAYEQAALYGATLEIVDFSPEIDTYLRILCFPTFRGHCGCILSDVSQIHYTRTSREAPEALMHYFGKLLESN
ncbi:MAG: LytTR family transcriptional regulator DNA-binding domain-containing protein [Firmicutes bacterium]|nr:LytTR family transcriptional regulator DNA-binding domain-containing protein [Bacillota bacterium]